MTGKDLELSGTRADFDPQTNQPVVAALSSPGHGSHQFQQITKAECQRGQTKCELAGARRRDRAAEPVRQHFAIVLDNQL